MMQTSVHCPMCRGDKIGATVRSIVPTNEREAVVFATCNVCRTGFALFYKTDQKFLSSEQDREILGDMGDQGRVPAGWARTLSIPKRPEPKMVGHLPEQVRSALFEAEQNFADRRWSSASVGYRRAIERCLKILYPEARGTLFTRIEALHTQNALPKPMIDLLHSVRFLGNDGAHELDDPTPEDVKTGRDFTHLLLTYLVELPERVRIASEKRENANSG